MSIQKIKLLTGTTLALLLSGTAIYPAMATPEAGRNRILLSQANTDDTTGNTVRATVRRVVNNEVTLALPNGDIQRITLTRLERERLNLRPGVQVEARMESGKLVPLERRVSQASDSLNTKQMSDRSTNIAQAESDSSDPIDSNLNPTQRPEVGPTGPDPSSSDISPDVDDNVPNNMEQGERNMMDEPNINDRDMMNDSNMMNDRNMNAPSNMDDRNTNGPNMMDDRNTNDRNFDNQNTNDRNINPTERPEVGPNDGNMSPNNRTQTPATNFNTSSPNQEIRGEVESYDGTNVRVRLSDGTVRTYSLDSQDAQQMNMNPGQGVIIRTDGNRVTNVQPTIRGYW